jgi:aryl-alcohol dehydrogenase-like predicted oxidoreductase
MEQRQFGKTGLRVSRLGIGLAEIGYELSMALKAGAARVLNTALDGGINFLDTSACYQISEDLIGQSVAHRRSEFVLATKCGHVAGGYEGKGWTKQTIDHSIERSLKRLKTDYLDIVQLHSCRIEILEKGESITALEDAKRQGKIRFVGYSGDNEAALWAVKSGRFDTLQTSFNLVDQKARGELFAAAGERRMGIIIKRPIANAAWGAVKSPKGYANQYHERARRMINEGPLARAPEDRILLAMGFVGAHDEVDTMILGSKNPEHIAQNIERFETKLPIPEEVVEELYRRFNRLGTEWRQLT